MRRHSMFALLGAMAVAAPSVAPAQQFEGVIKQRSIAVSLQALVEQGFDVSEALLDVPVERLLALRGDELFRQDAMTVTEETIYVKGNLLRSDGTDEEGPSWTTVNLERGIFRMFRPSEKMYMEMTKEDMEQMRAMGGGAPSEQPEIRETGLTRTINGMKCTAYDVETDEGITRVWVSQDYPKLVSFFLQLSESFIMDEEVQAAMLVAKHGFPVLEQRLPHSISKRYSIEEVLSAERQSVSDDLFTPPAGYRKTTMAEMMRRP